MPRRDMTDQIAAQKAGRRRGAIKGTLCSGCGATQGVWLIQVAQGICRYGPKIERCETCLPSRGLANRFRFVREVEW